MPSLADLLDGKAGSQLWVRLSTSPLPSPPTLAGLVEASFAGYQQGDPQILTRNDILEIWSFLTLQVNFTNSNITEGVPLTAAYLVAQAGGVEYLLSLVPLVGKSALTLPLGETNLQFTFALFELPSGG